MRQFGFRGVTIGGRKVIGRLEAPILIRYVLWRSPGLGVYLHRWMRSDYDRALHDHPWSFLSVVLWGYYIEQHDNTPERLMATRRRSMLSVAWHGPLWRHRVIIPHGLEGTVWTLFVVGKRQRRWGFHLPTGWCWWRQHNPSTNLCEDGIVHEHGGD